MDSAASDAWLSRLGKHSATVITAWNPYSRRSTDAANEAKNAELTAAVKAAELAYTPANGRDPSGTWHEASLCVFDCAAEQRAIWLLEFGQNAALLVERGRSPELVWHWVFRDEEDADIDDHE
jgi:hypothetical protein